MTAPNQPGYTGSITIGGGEFNFGRLMTPDIGKALMSGETLGKFEGVELELTDRVLNPINDHSRSITELREVYEQLILQGVAKVFTSNNTYTPTPGIVSIDVIIIGAGGGGSSGSYDALTFGARSGGGGGGGGETHTRISAALLPTNPDGTFKPIQIVIGAGGAGALSDAQFGSGGGHTYFGPEVGSSDEPWLMAGGGQGGVWGNPGTIALGGIGMVPGGNGGRGGFQNQATIPPTHSTSSYELNGGGGGGGAGSTQLTPATVGGGGGISPGGNPGNPGETGKSPSQIVATGGGGGGGGQGGNAAGGHGGYPAGGGGGSACGGLGVGGGRGGNGGAGIVFVIERMS